MLCVFVCRHDTIVRVRVEFGAWAKAARRAETTAAAAVRAAARAQRGSGKSADAAVDAGAVADTLHARTRAQGYAGKADWPAIAALKEAMASKGIPVFGSGDVFSAVAALGMLAETGADGVLLARGSMGNPFVFAEALAMWEERPYTACSDAELAAMATRHLDRSVASLGEKTACIEFRKHFCAYSKGRERGAALREKAVHCSTRAEFEEVFKALAAHDPGTSDTVARQA